MIAAILQILGSGAFGSLIGGILQVWSRKEERASAAEKNRHDEAMFKLQNEQALALADKAREQVREQGEQVVAKVEADAFQESQKNTGIAWSELLKSWVRTGIVAWLLFLSTALTFKIGRLVGGLESLDPKVLIPLYADIICQVFFLVNLSVSWYFGSRGTSISKRAQGASVVTNPIK